jgi:hypothetical protein
MAEDRRKAYMEVLDPFNRLFASVKGDANEQQEAADHFSSYKYRKAFVELTLFGSDGVVRAYNELAHYLITEVSVTPFGTLPLWGTLQLEIRKSLGNKGTKPRPTPPSARPWGDPPPTPDRRGIASLEAPRPCVRVDTPYFTSCCDLKTWLTGVISFKLG